VQEGARDGDAIFHPSSKGPDRLSLSIRLFSTAAAPVIQNIDVCETKASKVGNHLTLGTPLRIEVFQYHDKAELEFEDLDEVLVRFVGPYVAKFREVQHHRKFLDLPPVRFWAPCCVRCPDVLLHLLTCFGYWCVTLCSRSFIWRWIRWKTCVPPCPLTYKPPHIFCVRQTTIRT
jgi:SH2 domain